MRDWRGFPYLREDEPPGLVDLAMGRDGTYRAAPAMVEAAAPPPSAASRIVGALGAAGRGALDLVGDIASVAYPPLAAARWGIPAMEEAQRRRREMAPLEMKRAQLELAAMERAAAAQAAQAGVLDERIGSASGPERESLIRGRAGGPFRPFGIEPGPAELAAYENVLGMEQEEARQKLIAQREERQAQLAHQLSLAEIGARGRQEVATEREKRALGPEAPDDSAVAGLRKEFVSSAKAFETVRDATARLEASAKNPSPAGDLALIFSFMRALDPGSTVREGEFANAQNTAGIPDQVRNLYNRVRTGERLSEEQRADFLGRGKSLYREQELLHQATRQAYGQIAVRRGIDPRDVLDVVTGLPESEQEAESPEAIREAFRAKRITREEALKRLQAQGALGAP